MDGVLFHMFLRRHVLTKIHLVPLGLSVGGQRSINQPTLNLLTYYFTHIFHSASCVINVRVWKRRTRQCPPLHLIFFFFARSLSGWPTVLHCQMEGLVSPSTRCFREKTWLWNSSRQQLLGYAIVWSSLWLHIHTQSAKFFMRAVSLVVIYSYQTPPPTWPLLYQPWERQVQDKMWRIRAITWRMVKEEKKIQVQLKHFPFKSRPKSKRICSVLVARIVKNARKGFKWKQFFWSSTETKILWKKRKSVKKDRKMNKQINK